MAKKKKTPKPRNPAGLGLAYRRGAGAGFHHGRKLAVKKGARRKPKHPQQTPEE